MKVRQLRMILLTLLAGVVSPTGVGEPAFACNIPVFRYALERWRPDPCQLIVFHHSPLTEQDAAWVTEMEQISLTGSGLANVRIVQTDPSQSPGPDPDLQDVWQTVKSNANPSQPYVVARSVISRGRTVTHWQGTLQTARTAGLLHSPARTELIRRLQSGHAVVWLLVKSPNENRNQQIQTLLREQLDALSAAIELPEGIGLPGSELFSEVPLLLRFSVLHIDPEDEQEKFLVQLLTGFQPESVERQEPLVVPVFGRGRALEVIPADRLNAGLIEDLTVFLCGACSCQVKELNPGFDLLLTSSWNTALFGEDASPPPPRTEGENRSSAPVLLPIPSGRGR